MPLEDKLYRVSQLKIFERAVPQESQTREAHRVKTPESLRSIFSLSVSLARKLDEL